jgi:hypothetical protein
LGEQRPDDDDGLSLNLVGYDVPTHHENNHGSPSLHYYSQKDGDVPASLASKLADVGIKCFMADRSVLAGAQWEPQLR